MLSRPFQPFEKIAFWFTGIITLVSVMLGWYLENYYLLGVPFFLLLCYLSVVDFRIIFYLLMGLIPLSIEFSFPNGMGTDLPTEPIMVGLMLVFFGYVLGKKRAVDYDFLTHPLITILLIHLTWLIITVVYSSLFIVSFKFVLAKIWYIVVFTFMGGVVVKELKDFKILFWCFLPTLLFTIVYTIIRHAAHDFSFSTVNVMMEPFFRNHVVYAATVALTVPFVWLSLSWFPKSPVKKTIIVLILLVMIVAVFLSYTRSSWLSLIIAPLFAFVIRKRLVKWAAIVFVTALLSFIGYMVVKNHYLNFAPDYAHTVMHEELGDHLQATYQMEDLSSEERVYRWIAGFRMWEANPIVGYGPGNFYNFYKPYTVSRFRTYVSANPERSTVHNYFLLTLVEQGIIGLIIFFTLTIMLFLQGQRIYHETVDKQERKWVMAILLCAIIIYVNTFLSDLIEVDKIGTIFFLNIAMLVNQDIRNRRLRNLRHAQPDDLPGIKAT